ncbi:tail protein [Caballeronia novacaledonica]|uniref:Tail protein n=1 Tax=Caballeronia novacaledonica TaxID=1544861 RepID=A0A2U3I8Q7_9BURK|nr:hypothetical protein [Caballeronia novacaledonica]SPB16537.1 tail protein [Caballeronia novacaledonica]
MRRISTATKVVDKFGVGKPGFTNGNAVSGIAATDLEDVWFDHVQEEIANVVEASGQTLDPNDRTQLLAAIQSMFSPVVGTVRNLSMSVSAASASATMSADEIIVATALNGRTYRLASFSKTINLATTGAGGMDTGTAPVSGFVALYAIFNPTTGASALLAKNATSAVQPNVYGGANMPASYTASALVSVWPTNASGQFVGAGQVEREVSIATSNVLTTSTVQASLTSFSAGGVLPLNARTCRGDFTIGSSTASAGANAVLSGSPSEIGRVAIGATSATAGATTVVSYSHIAIQTPQTLYYRAAVSGGTLNFLINVTAYTF